MIKNVSYGLESKNYAPKKAEVKSTLSNPIQSNKTVTDYSIDNLKANYMISSPISFHGSDEKVVGESTDIIVGLNVQDIKKKLLRQVPPDSSYVVSNLPQKEKIKGSFYQPLSNDLAILLNSDKDVMLLMENGVNPEIFVQKFAERISDNEYKKVSFDRQTTDVIFIQDPVAFSKSNLMENAINDAQDSEILDLFKNTTHAVFQPDTRDAKDNPNYFLSGLQRLDQQDDKCKIVFVKDFDKIASQIGEFYDGKTLQQNLMSKYPNLRVVGLIDKSELTALDRTMPLSDKDLVKKRNLFKNLEKMPQLLLTGLTTHETEAFFRNNPVYYFYILDKYQPYFVDVSQNGMKKIISNAAKDIDMALPSSALLLLDRVASAKLQEAKPFSQNAPLRIISADIDRYYDRHKAVANISNNSKLQVHVAEKVETRFNNLAGLKTAKSKIAEDYFEYFKNPKAYLASGRKVPGGLLFTGPPGTGKTEMARAIAGEVKEFTGKDIPFFYMSGSEFGNKYINSGAMAVRGACEDARNYMKKIGAKFGVLFIDEIDPICRKTEANSNSGQTEDAKTTDELKVQLGGFSAKDSDERLLIIGATNHPEVFDDALLRPSRFRQIEFNMLSNKKDIVDLLNIHAKKKPFANEFDKSLLLDELAEYVKGLNGDQMTQILDEATKLALKTADKVITKKEILEGFINTLFGEKVEIDSSPEERLHTSLHEVGHAEAAVTLKEHTLIAISNEARGKALASTFSLPPQKNTTNFESIIKELALCYGGGEAEKLSKKAHDAGVSGDYKRITALTEAAVKKYSLGLYTPQRSFFNEDGQELVELSKQYASEIKKDQEILTETAQRVIKQTLKAHKDFILNKYLKENEEAILAGKDGKNYLADDYMAIRNEWFEKTGIVKAEPVLEQGNNALIEVARNDKFWTEYAEIKNARNIMSEGVETIVNLSQERSWLDNPSKTAEELNRKIAKIVDLAENGSKWIMDAGKTDAEKKLIDAVNKIVDSVRNTDKKASLKIFKKLANAIK